MGKFFSEFLKLSRILLITMLVLAGFIGAWCGTAWLLGWVIKALFHWQDMRPDQYIAFGSVVLIFTAAVQIETIVATGISMLAWGRSKGMIK